MRTNIIIDDTLMADVLKATGGKIQARGGRTRFKSLIDAKTARGH
jgi:Arc/MetJ family transcription regulator